jgi:hypothetical protein
MPEILNPLENIILNKEVWEAPKDISELKPIIEESP